MSGRGGCHYRGGRGGGHIQQLRRDRSPDSNSSDPGHYPGSTENGGRSLAAFLRSVDGSNYAALKQLTRQTYPLPSDAYPGMTLTFLSVQSDPFAPGSQVCVTLPCPSVPLPYLDSNDVNNVTDDDTIDDAVLYRSIAQMAAEDFILRSIHGGLPGLNQSRSALQFLRPSQHVIARSAVAITNEVQSNGGGDSNGNGNCIRVYLCVKLPGHGRRIDGRGAARILFGELQPLLERHVLQALAANSTNNTKSSHVSTSLSDHVTSVQDQEWLRRQLRPRGLVAFVADGAVLPRTGGDSDLPLAGAVPFCSPASLSVVFDLPFSGRRATGMGLPFGLTLIAGGGFHGKSTLLRALELGVYSHTPDDGRAFVCVDATAVKIRAEDRRSISGVDISPFITNLPFGKDTTAFSTADASGSTSQAANIIEALELGCSALLLDEDTSATNFMYRDAMMQRLVPPAQEPITPFVCRVRELVEARGVSAVMVVGGSGQYFAPADVVLVLDCYAVHDRTEAAKAIATAAGGVLPAPAAESASVFLFDDLHWQQHQQQGHEQQQPTGRCLLYADTFRSIVPGSNGAVKMSGAGLDTVRLSGEGIAIGLVEQVVEEGQVNAIAQCIALVYDGGVLGASSAQAGWVLPRDVAYPPALCRGNWWRSEPAMPRTVGSSACGASMAPTSGFARLVANAERQLRAARLEMRQPSCYLPTGFTALPRTFEIAAALNRMRMLRTGIRK